MISTGPTYLIADEIKKAVTKEREEIIKMLEDIYESGRGALNDAIGILKARGEKKLECHYCDGAGIRNWATVCLYCNGDGRKKPPIYWYEVIDYDGKRKRMWSTEPIQDGIPGDETEKKYCCPCRSYYWKIINGAPCGCACHSPKKQEGFKHLGQPVYIELNQKPEGFDPNDAH
jgi:hypothetical protein